MMNTPFEHLVNNRVLTTYKTVNEELDLNPQKNYLFDLSYLDVLDVEGDKTIDFLHGQLTCDVRSISDIQIIQGAQCNLKGRILTLIDIISWQGIKLILPKDLTEVTINSLSKTAMLSRVSLKTNKSLSIFGFYLQNKEDIVPITKSFPDTVYGLTSNIHSCCYHLGNGFYIFLVHHDFAHEIYNRFIEKNQLLGSLTWHTLRLTHRQIDIYPESRGIFLPHRLDLHQTQYVSFNKGCYKGQEIIARMHFKATIKHEMRIDKIKTSQKIYSGQKILNRPEGTELGEMIDYSFLGNDNYVVAMSILKGVDQPIFF